MDTKQGSHAEAREEANRHPCDRIMTIIEAFWSCPTIAPQCELRGRLRGWRSGAFDTTTPLTPKSPITLEMKQFESGQGRVVITASTAVQPAYDASGERAESLFTHYFVEGLQIGQERVSVYAAYQYAHAQVKTKQTPEISLSHQQGEIFLTRNPRYAPLSLNHHFLCYSPRDGAEPAARLHTALQAAGLRPWLDTRDTPAGYDPHAAREDALRECASALLVLTPGSADVKSDSTREWQKALQYKKPILPLRFVEGAACRLQVGNRPALDFAGPLDSALPALHQHLAELNTPAGQVHELEYRKADAEGELRTATGSQRERILSDLERLDADLARQREVARDRCFKWIWGIMFESPKQPFWARIATHSR